MATLTFKHVKRDKTERPFTGKVVKTGPGYELVKPDRAFFIQAVRFAPGHGPKDYVESYKHLDEQLKKKYGKSRCQMDVHEIATFITLGRYDMIVLWDAPDADTFHRVVAEQLNPNGHGSSETLGVVTTQGHT